VEVFLRQKQQGFGIVGADVVIAHRVRSADAQQGSAQGKNNIAQATDFKAKAAAQGEPKKPNRRGKSTRPAHGIVIDRCIRMSIARKVTVQE
jgi:hypothetical protein